MVLELIQLIQRKLSYLKEFDTCLEILLITSTIVFVAGVQGEECFCAPGYIWQFGSLALFLGWIDLVLFLKKLPITGIHIIMLQGVLITFLKLVYLPIILIIAFAFPFNMLFSKVSLEAVCSILYNYSMYACIYTYTLSQVTLAVH